MKIRPVVDVDVQAVLALNEESVWALSPLDETGFARHVATAAHAVVCEVDGKVAAFAFAYAPGTSYDSVNYRWFAERFQDFLYLDRIAVGASYRRNGIAALMYDEIEQAATAHERMVCEVNSQPPNEASLAFHAARGYRELGHLVQADGHETAMLEKLLEAKL